ncbi:MAG: energy-coupling factor ABC transporter ATP-binding protein [Candidatus Marinimicrobia bacterium]|nr:energy-coupling factor ABC transporter ATP-binding protein [Candidatus Neomarinimicrobiota bacterium]MCF7828141.1 energy-coupling factor ABC transporter ATP-binding protein [Candidatus Neomarinimicrobiota bacterium]MCF7879684.1 energy-coupling factor ABC transporter ATP-binding protein [Candidatus Neomarinimicrobiota bacterium]
MPNLIEISDIHHQVHKRLSIDIDQLFFQDGPIYGLIGEAGSGKTTLLRILALLQPVEKGKITVFETPADAKKHPKQLRRRLGYLPQQPTMFSGTVADNIAMGLHFRRKDEEEIEARVKNLLAEFHCSDLGRVPANQLSRGQQQIVALLRTLAPYPEVLLMDEPSTHLDKDQYDLFLNYIKMLNNDRGVTIILSTKSKDIVRRVVNISISMRYGKIVRIRTGEHQLKDENGSGPRIS